MEAPGEVSYYRDRWHKTLTIVKSHTVQPASPRPVRLLKMSSRRTARMRMPEQNGENVLYFFREPLQGIPELYPEVS